MSKGQPEISLMGLGDDYAIEDNPVNLCCLYKSLALKLPF